MLVAEIYYPDTYFPGNPGDQPAPGREPIKASPPSDLNQYLLKRSGGAAGSSGGWQEGVTGCAGQTISNC